MDVNRWARGDTLRAERLGTRAGWYRLAGLDNSSTPWFETKDEIREGLRWGEEKAARLKWVRGQMVMRLTYSERRAIHLYYFRGLSYRQASQIMRMSPSSVCRAVERGLRKLKKAAKISKKWKPLRPIRLP